MNVLDMNSLLEISWSMHKNNIMNKIKISSLMLVLLGQLSPKKMINKIAVSKNISYISVHKFMFMFDGQTTPNSQLECFSCKYPAETSVTDGGVGNRAFSRQKTATPIGARGGRSELAD